MASRISERPEYANPVIPEGINTTDEHPLKEFVWLGGSIVAVVIVVIMALGWLGQLFGAFVPFETEQRLAASLSKQLDDAQVDARAQPYVQALTDRLVLADPLPKGMRIVAHVSNDARVNAFATLGGHIVVTRGLLTHMPDENALATVIAHEIAHVRERHVIRSLSRGVLMSMGIALLSGGDELSGELIGQAGFTAALGFSRDQERAADRIGLGSVHRLYGHVNGAASVFEALGRAHPASPPEWLSTHPDHRNRIASIAQHANEAAWDTEGDTTPLPEWVAELKKN